MVYGSERILFLFFSLQNVSGEPQATTDKH